MRKLGQGSKGRSIRHRRECLTRNEFQCVSGRETAKDRKRSIHHKGKSLKTLMSKGILQAHPPIYDCPGCRISSAMEGDLQVMPTAHWRRESRRILPVYPGWARKVKVHGDRNLAQQGVLRA
ncbi:deformed epidermal autoregulatory factor 1 homolog [Trichechus inunguis]